MASQGSKDELWEWGHQDNLTAEAGVGCGGSRAAAATTNQLRLARAGDGVAGLPGSLRCSGACLDRHTGSTASALALGTCVLHLKTHFALEQDRTTKYLQTAPWGPLLYPQ